MEVRRVVKSTARLLLAVIIGLALLSSLPTTGQADGDPVDLELGGEGATSWTIVNIKPGDSGTKTVTLHNAGYRDGFVSIWISDIVSSEGTNPESETGDITEPGELVDYLLFDLSCSRLSTNLSLPAGLDDFPQSASDSYYIKVSPLNAGDTINLDWEWELPSQASNDVQGDSLSFTVNYVLEELPAGGGGGDDGDSGRDSDSPVEPRTLLLQVDMWGKVTSAERTDQGVVMETIEAVSPDGALLLLLPQGTRVLDSVGNPLDLIEVKPVTPPQPPPGKLIIGPSYDIQPSCTFESPIKLILHYRLQGLRDGSDGKDLVIACWDQGSQEWVVLPGVVDTLTETVTVQLSNSSTFVMLAAAPVVTLILPQEPTVLPVPDTTPEPALGTGAWLGIAAGVALLLSVIVWLVKRQGAGGHMIRLIKRMKLRGQQGMTLVEVLIAVSVLGIVGVSIMSGLNASSKAIISIREINIAESLTRTQTEYIRRSEYDYRKAETALSADIDSSQNFIPVMSTADFLRQGVVTIEDEQIEYTYRTGTELRDCTRGVSGTTATSHSSGESVVHDPNPPTQPVYILDPDLDLSIAPYHGEYSIEVEAVRLDPESDGFDDDDGIQKITVKVYHKGRLLLSTDTYKAYR